MTDFEKKIYNCWLATTRSRTNQPFKIRKKWDDFENRPEYLHVKKLAKLFKVYHNIKIDEWFQAPYEMYPEKVQYDLKYYTLMRNYNTYRLYKQKKDKRKYTPKEFVNLLKNKVENKKHNNYNIR